MTVRDHALELGVLLAQLPQFAQLAQGQTALLLFPHVKSRLADAMLAADIGDPCATLRLVQGPQNLLFEMSLLRHPRVLLALFQKTTLNVLHST
jgi:hypothetical protein